MKLSVVIPAYNAEKFIISKLTSLCKSLASQNFSFEILVVDDGSTDQTFELISQLALSESSVRPLKLDSNQGKFAAIGAGVAESCGDCIIFTDADIPFSHSVIIDIERLVNNRGIQIVIGDRSLEDSVYLLEISKLRKYTTWVFSYFVKLLVSGGLFDTQCGLKGFRSDVAKVIFPLLTNKGFAGDVELLYIALKYNLEIKRIPVKLQSSEPTTVKFWLHGVSMLKSIIVLRHNWKSGIYSSNNLRTIVVEGYRGQFPKSDSDGSDCKIIKNKI